MNVDRKHNACVIASCVLCLFVTPSFAQVLKSCPAVEVKSVSATAQITNPPNNEAAIKDEISELPNVDAAMQGAARKLVALGPMYNAFDSMDIHTNVICTKKGVALESTVMRSENVSVTIMRNTLWRPEVTMLFSPLKSSTEVKIIWAMQLSNGKPLFRAKTGGYPEQKYPIVVTKIVR